MDNECEIKVNVWMLRSMVLKILDFVAMHFCSFAADIRTFVLFLFTF